MEACETSMISQRPSSSSIKILYTSFFAPMRPTCPAHLILLDLTILIVRLDIINGHITTDLTETKPLYAKLRICLRMPLTLQNPAWGYRPRRAGAS
jgi:hypothetical protein